MKLNTNSNVYTIIYATVIVIIVALLLAVVSSALRPRQAANVELDRKKQVLSSLNIDLKGQDVDALYSELIEETERAGKPIYVATLSDGSNKFIIPMRGAGLWGPIWGYVALNDDMSTIYGTFFNHESETPGLGGEITTEKFQNGFIGKHVLENGVLRAVEIVKGDAAGEQVQAISGATITSKGVETMINTALKDYEQVLTGNSSDKPCCKAGKEGCCKAEKEGCCKAEKEGCCKAETEGCCKAEKEGCCKAEKEGCCKAGKEGCCKAGKDVEQQNQKED